MTDAKVLPPEAGQDDEISLLDLALVLASRKRVVIGLPLCVAVLAVALTLLMKNVYTASTKILPPQQGQSSASAMLAQLGGLAGLAGGAAGLKSPADLYIGMLKSRTVADELIAQFKLDARYEAAYPSAARKALEGNTKIAAGKDGIIEIEVTDKDPQIAAALANAYVDALFRMTKSLALTEAAQRRLFFERQFAQAKDNLAKAEVAARDAMAGSGLIKVDDQGRSVVETTAKLRAQVAVKEVQIGAMRGYAAEENPQLVAARQELAALKNELEKLEGLNAHQPVSPSAAAKSERGMRNLALLRDMKYYETVYELMAKQYELAKIDEAKDPSLIQVVDKAIPPDRKSGPKRALIVIAATLAAAVLTMIGVFFKAAFDRQSETPETAEKWRALRAALRLRGTRIKQAD